MVFYNTRKDIILKRKSYKTENKKLHGIFQHFILVQQFSKRVTHFFSSSKTKSINISDKDLQETSSFDTKEFYHSCEVRQEFLCSYGDPKEDFCEDDLESSGLKENEYWLTSQKILI
jgi:hypothetical protein